MQTVIYKLQGRAINNGVTRELVSAMNSRLALFNEFGDQWCYEEWSVYHEALTDMLRLLRDIEADTLSHRARSDPSYASRQRRVAKGRIFKQGDVLMKSYVTAQTLRVERQMREGLTSFEEGRRFLRDWEEARGMDK